ncbi:MAG TPA: hypothetical protein DCG75_01885 [Bacteroidales bacterium]|nr:hypothetical protein [Bacteroidales bacterium]
MKKTKLISILIILIGIYFTSCNRKENNTQQLIPKKDIAAFINDSLITIQELDNSVQQELYDELNRIYAIRKVSLDYMITEKIFEIEAKKAGVTVENYINKYYYDNLTDNLLTSFIKKNKLESGIIELKRTLRLVNINSPEGEKLLYKEYKNYLRKHLADSLRLAYNIKINLTPPQSPSFSLNKIFAHYRGNLNSKVIMLEISDLECSSCKESYPIFKQIYDKYKDQVKFGFTHFSSYVSVSAIACECASLQGKFWEMHDSIFELSNLPDTTAIMNIAKKMGLDINQFRIDFKDSTIVSNIENNFRNIHDKGIYATPTIIINNKAIFNSASLEEIENLLSQELGKLE